MININGVIIQTRNPGESCGCTKRDLDISDGRKNIPSTATSCVAQSITKQKNTHVKKYSLLLASAISFSAWLPNHSNMTELTNCTGTIQLFRRPIFGLHIASTIGDHSSFIE